MNYLTATAPIEARFAATEETVRKSVSAVCAVLSPRRAWFFAGACIGVALAILLILHRPLTVIALRVIGIVISIAVGIAIHRFEIQHQQGRLLGKLVVVRFFEDGFDFGRESSVGRIAYSRLVRAGRNPGGLVMLLPGLRGMF